MRVHGPPTTTPPTTREVRSLCSKHTGLTAAALAELAPIAIAGHSAHLVLFMAEHADAWASSGTTPPAFVARSPVAKACTPAQAAKYVADAGIRELLEGHRQAGEVATAHLVALAEGMIRRVVHQIRLRESSRTTVVDCDDMHNTGRAAVAQGVWAYDPERPSGAHYLRPWIEEHVKRDLAGQTYQVSIPVRVRARFIRIAAIRASLCEKLGREPTDREMLDRPDAAYSKADLIEERNTRHRRIRTGLGMRQIGFGRMVLHRKNDITESILMRLVTHDRSDVVIDQPETVTLQRIDDEAGVAASGWRAALEVLQLGPVQKEILARAIGLAPHEHLPETQRSERAIAAELGLRRSTVHEVIAAVRTELSQRGGRFHHLLAGLSDEDLEGLGLQGFVQVLGELPAPDEPPGQPPRILTKALISNGIPRSSRTGWQGPWLIVRYECVGGHCGWAAYERAAAARFVLREVRCPDCGEAAAVTRRESIVAGTRGEAG